MSDAAFENGLMQLSRQGKIHLISERIKVPGEIRLACKPKILATNALPVVHRDKPNCKDCIQIGAGE